MYTRYVKKSNLRKEVGIAIKSKETSSQLEPVINSYVAITCNQMCVQTKHSLAHLQDLIPTLVGIIYVSDNISQSMD